MVSRVSSSLTNVFHYFGRIFLAAGVFEGGVEGGVIARVCHGKLVVKLRHLVMDDVGMRQYVDQVDVT